MQMHVYMCVHAYVRMHMYIYICVHTLTCVCICLLVHMYIHTYIYTHIPDFFVILVIVSAEYSLQLFGLELTSSAVATTHSSSAVGWLRWPVQSCRPPATTLASLHVLVVH